ncbi:MAG: uracil-DNA glycosylase [Actinomycetota bacterium]
MHRDWGTFLAAEQEQPYFRDLLGFVAAERSAGTVFPAEDRVFAAFDLTPFASVRVVILGQDPYHGPGQANGLAFSVNPGTAVPPSLRNIHRELHDDTGLPAPGHGDLTPWARRGVLLLNTTLTVREGHAGSHHGRGWERLTDAVITLLDRRDEPTVFVLWGAHARSKRVLVTNTAHSVIESAHPSPLSARSGFFGSRPFSRANALLAAAGRDGIDWSLQPPGTP